MIQKINYADKQTGGKFSASDANEIKSTVNLNADVLSKNSQSILSLQGGQLGSIKPTDAAPTPTRNGNYTFSIGGDKPAWLTAEEGVTEVKAGDGVAVVYSAPSSYTYTHVDVSSDFVTIQELNVTINDLKASKFIREIYCFGTWATQPDGLILINSIRKAATYGTGIVFYDSNKTILWNCNNLSTSDSFVYAESGGMKFYAVLDWSALANGEDYQVGFKQLIKYNDLNICPTIQAYLNKVDITNNLGLKSDNNNLHNDPHFNFILPTITQKDIVNDYLFTDMPILYLGNNLGAKYNIVGASGGSNRIKIRASQLKKWGINSGDYISVALKIKAESNISPSNAVYVFGNGYSTITLSDTNWKLITINKQVTYSDNTDIIELLTIAVDNTHSSGCRYLFVDGLTIIKVADSITKLTKTLEPGKSINANVGKNIILDYELNLSSKHTEFLKVDEETIVTKVLGVSSYDGVNCNSVIVQSTTNQLFRFQQDILIPNAKRINSFRRGIRMKITILESTVPDYTEAVLFLSRYKSSYSSELPLKSNVKLGEWIDILSPNYIIENTEDYIHWSYRLELPAGKYKLEFINPTICELSNNIYDFQITDNSRMDLPMLGKKWCSFGDSLTDGGLWQVHVQELTGVYPYIRGVGASSIMRDMFPCWISPSTKEHITNILYAGYPTNLDPTTLNNYDSNCVTFKGMFSKTADRDRIIPSPQTGDYIWWSNGVLTPTWVRQYYNGSAWITLTETVVDSNEGVLYTTINGRISSQDRVDTIPLDSDIITIMAGTNDWENIGTIDDYDNGTFMGNYRKMLDEIYNRCPLAKVVVCLFPKFGAEYNVTTHVLTGTGIIRQTIRDSLRLLCEKYGYSLIDMQPASNFQNMKQYLGDDLTHPTSFGGKYWAKIFTQQFI